MSDETPMLALPYKRFIYSFDGDFAINGTPVLLSTPCNQRESDEAVDGDTGSAIWDAAVLLARYLDRHPSLVAGNHVVELGSGLGLCGVVCSLLGAEHVYLTDLDYILDTAISNAKKNRVAARTTICSLDWFEPEKADLPWRSIGLLIASDTIWLDQLVEPFARTLKFALRSNPSLTIILSNQRRSDLVWNKFHKLAAQFCAIELLEEDSSLEIYRLVYK